MAVLNAVCPLLQFDNHWPEFIGSGIFMGVGPSLLVASCAHVYDLANGGAIHTRGADGQSTELVGIGRVTSIPAGSNREADRADCFYLKLNEDTVERLGNTFARIGPNQISFDRIAVAYTFAGFSRRLAGPRGRGAFHAQVETLTGGAATEGQLAALGLSSASHIGIRLGGGPLTDERGRTLTAAPRLNGISGGPVMVGFDPQSPTPDAAAMVVGLCMEVPPEAPDLMLGVRISAIIEGVRTQFPELSPDLPRDPGVSIEIGHG
jgi:hypothetical protein